MTPDILMVIDIVVGIAFGGLIGVIWGNAQGYQAGVKSGRAIERWFSGKSDVPEDWHE